ncbi:MauE/DoxX family redox-associated membrane protein [Nonomuraea wenchangensis]|uniref:MauE/DoxX family redox-associated membrane protein n=1 Tax=Nonomuraea wenchangensis TaxID=568860 RepID=UPI003439ACE2
MDYLALTARCALGLVFLVAVIGKVRGRAAYEAFRRSVPELVPLPRGAASAVLPALVLPALVVAAECAVVVLLAVERTAAAGLALAAAVLLAFTAGIGRALRAGVRASCRCFGMTPSPLGRLHLVRNLALAALAVAGAAAVLAGAPGQPHPAGVALAVAGGALLALPAVFADDLAALLAPAPRR